MKYALSKSRLNDKMHILNIYIRCESDMTDRLSEFVQYIDESGVAANTREAYERDIRLLMRQLSADGVRELEDISSAELMQYVDGLSAKGKSTATISRTVASIRRFFAFTHSRGYTFSDPSEMLKTPKVIKKTPAILSDKDIKRIIMSVDTDTTKGIRDKAMLELIISTGIGATEILELTVSDVDLRSQTVSAGSKKRRVSISKRAADMLRAYDEVRDKLLNGQEDCGVFFLSCSGRRMSRQGLWKIIRAAGVDAGIDNITPQMLRHSFAVSALRHGKDVGTVQKILGHTTKAGALEYQSMAEAGM